VLERHGGAIEIVDGKREGAELLLVMPLQRSGMESGH
jgi:hypothetical protein